MGKDTLERIELAISELNFRPNRVARQLKTGHAALIGMLVPSIANPMFASLAREVEIAARSEYGYRILLGNTYRQKEEEQVFLDDLLSHGVRGVIVVSSLAEQSHFKTAIDSGLVMVNYDRRAVEVKNGCPLTDNISMNNFEAGRIAARHLIDHGCKRIAFTTASGKTISRVDKIEGFMAAAKDAGLTDDAFVIEGKAQSEYGDTEMADLGKKLAEEISAMKNRPDGIVAVNDMMAIGLISGFRGCGIKVPDDISLVGIEDIFLSSLVSPAITSVRPPIAEMAKLMVDRLIARLSNPSIPAEDFLFTPVLIARESVISRVK